LHPANGYVADFVKDVPRTKVLTAGAVMRPVNGTALAEQAVDASTVLDDLLPLLAQSKSALPVIDETAQLIGCVDHQGVMLALTQTGSTARHASGYAS
jgi:glycine betaine/proline transport system ATP-binding protein